MKKTILMPVWVCCVIFIAAVFQNIPEIGFGYNSVMYDNSISITAVLNGDGTVTAGWSRYNHSDYFSSYTLVRSQTNSNPVYPDDGYIFHTTDSNNLMYIDTSVPMGTNYYRVCHVTGNNNIYCSSSVVTITKNSNYNNANISLTGSVSGTNVNLNWSVYGSNGYNGYRVVWATHSNPIYPDDNYHYISDQNTRSDIITNLMSGTTYYIRVCQYDSNGYCSSYSNEINLNVGYCSSGYCNNANISLTGSVSGTNVNLNWSVYGSNGYNGYRVVWATHSNPIYPDDDYHYIQDQNTHSDTITNLMSGTTYYIRVCQYDSNGYCSSYSNETNLNVGYCSSGYCNNTNMCTDTNWTPDPSTVCNGRSFMQTSDCRNTRMFAGIKDCSGDILFSDVPSTYWAKSYILKLLNQGVIMGRGDGLFYPEDPINRAEFMKMIVEAFYGNETLSLHPATPFSDVTRDRWYTAYITFGYERNLISGYSDNSFRPATSISRAEALAVLIKVLDVSLVNNPVIPFSDVVYFWQKQYVEAATRLGLMQGYSDTLFGPNFNLSRAEAAKIVSLAEEMKNK